MRGLEQALLLSGDVERILIWKAWSGMTPPNVKGVELEVAVHTIENHILASSPALRENSFTIESWKRVTVGGVHHEIDIFVSVDLGKGYTAVFIFECKNWETAVGKNEIVIFSEKIDALQAQRGYFVAKSFTKDAQAQAVKDPRITLLIATEHDPAMTPRSTFSITRHRQARKPKRCSVPKDQSDRAWRPSMSRAKTSKYAAMSGDSATI
jgi:hypothetical protein